MHASYSFTIQGLDRVVQVYTNIDQKIHRIMVQAQNVQKQIQQFIRTEVSRSPSERPEGYINWSCFCLPERPFLPEREQAG